MSISLTTLKEDARAKLVVSWRMTGPHFFLSLFPLSVVATQKSSLCQCCYSSYYSKVEVLPVGRGTLLTSNFGGDVVE